MGIERKIEVIGGIVTRSELIRVDSPDELPAEIKPQCVNPCGHYGVKSVDCWPFYIVECAVCGRGLGVA